MILEIFSENQKVINLHKKFGFQVTSKKIFQDKEIFL